MTSEDIIDLVTGEFDSHEEWHTVHSLGDVESVFRQVEAFLNQQNLHLEHEVETTDFEDIESSEDPDEFRTEVKFEIPILDTDLKLEFFYFKIDDNGFRILLDVDFYWDAEENEEEDEEQDEDN